MSNPWPYKNHQYGSNYSVVTVQEHFRKNQSNMRHPVCTIWFLESDSQLINSLSPSVNYLYLKYIQIETP